MGTSTCHCKALATRLVRVVDPKDTSHAIWTMGQELPTSTWACCEAHRHAVVAYMKERWADRIKAGTAKVLMGKRRKAGL